MKKYIATYQRQSLSFLRDIQRKTGVSLFLYLDTAKTPLLWTEIEEDIPNKDPGFCRLIQVKREIFYVTDDIVRRIKKKGQFLIIDFGNLHLQGNAQMGNNRPSLFIDSPSRDIQQIPNSMIMEHTEQSHTNPDNRMSLLQP